MDPKHLLYGILGLATLVWVGAILLRRLRRRRSEVAVPNTPNLEKQSPFKAAAREPGGNDFCSTLHPFLYQLRQKRY